jgi:hypothetical protein
VLFPAISPSAFSVAGSVVGIFVESGCDTHETERIALDGTGRPVQPDGKRIRTWAFKGCTPVV